MDKREEFVAAIKTNEGLIYKVTRLYSNSDGDAEDLYQEIVFQLWKSFSSFRNEAKLSTWMYRIALNTAITHLNRAKRKTHHIPIAAAHLNQPVLADAAGEEQVELMYAQIKKLDTLEKGIIFLFLEGKTYEEIAAITGFSSSNVGTRLSRIKQKIKNELTIKLNQ
jgi:RNA polymerase sigma factor (sigma-70 family)